MYYNVTDKCNLKYRQVQIIILLQLFMIQQFSRLAISSQDYLFTQIGESQIPSQYHDSPQIEKLDCLIIQNFKSFDKKYVGPFLNFTSIIGPNGSGKSNILDALMFCFCSQSSRHSLFDVRELINRQGKQSFKQLSKQHKVCSVEAHFILKNSSKFVISRTLDAEAKQQYFIDFKSVTKKVYQNILIRKGINCNTPNYAIWQGQIDRLLLRDPLQLTSLLENLSGSIYFKKPYDQAKQKLKYVQNTIEQKTRRINKFKVDKKNYKAIKQTNEQYTKYDKQYQQIMKKIYYLQVLQKDKKMQDLIEQVKRVSDQEKKKIRQINQLKQNAQKDYLKKSELQNDMNSIMSELAQSYNQLKNIGNPANILKVQKLKQAEEQLSKKIKQREYFQQKLEQLKASIPEIPPTPLVDEYLKLYEQWQSQNVSLHRETNKKKNQLLFIEGILQSKTDLVSQFQIKKSKHHQKKQQKQRTIKGFKQDLQVLKESIKIMQNQSIDVNEQIGKTKIQFQTKNRNYNQICSSIGYLQSIVSEQAQDQKQADMLKNLANIDGFHGALHQKIKPAATKYDICFSIIFHTIGKYLLCQSQEGSRKIGNRLKQIRLMKNIIILDNVLQKRTNDIRKSLGKQGTMCIDIVDYDREVKGFKQYLSQFLNGKVVCDNITIAYKIRNKNIEGVRQIYTLDGNVIKKDGSISTHGNPQALKKASKYSNNKTTIYQDIAKLTKQKIKIESQLRNLKLKFGEDELIKRRSQIDQMNRKKQLLFLKIKQLEGAPEKEPTVPPSVLTEIRQLEKQKDKLYKALVELQKMIGSSKIFDKFIQKNKIENLQAFRNANNFHHAEKQMKKKHQINKQISNIELAIQKIEKQIDNEKEELKFLQSEVGRIPQLGDKNKIQKQISEKQKHMIQIRNKLSKLTSINQNQTSFYSVLPPLQAKLNYTKQKMLKDLEDLAYELGIQYKYPIEHSEILQELNLPKKITEKTLQSLSQKLQQQRAKIEQELDKHNSINLLVNAEQDEERIQKGINTEMQQIQSAIKDRKKLTEQLDQIRKDRAALLNNFVIELKQHLYKSYALLTEQEDGSVGTVNFHMENEDQPFEHGIYFTPTPPTKRFVYDLEQLSGGEKSIASLALQYSLSLASKSPLLMLDQTDAFLDFGNVNRFLKLINQTMSSHKIQMIVVTHKQGLFCKSQSLVGVSRPKQLNLSQVYSLKLTEDQN